MGRKPVFGHGIAMFLWALSGMMACAQTPPDRPALPPDAAVVRVLKTLPTVRAAAAQIEVEEAQRARRAAGEHEWLARVGSQQRRVINAAGPNEQFIEWSAALERPLRLPGKAATDAELGAAGVAMARTVYGDALHEASRGLLRAWFAWLKENAALTQWNTQIALLDEQFKAVQRRQQLGDASQLEAVLAEAALAQARAQQTQVVLRQQLAEDELRRRYPGLPLVVPERIAEPVPLQGDAAAWLLRIGEHHHELNAARGEAERARLVAQRARQDRIPDPSVGVLLARERAGAENLIGAYLSIPLPGEARRAAADAALAQTRVSLERVAGVAQKVDAEAALQYRSAQAAYAGWQATRKAAERLSQAADMSARAYALGEGQLDALLVARRQANEAQLAARQSQLDALEQRYRLLLDAHELWDLDDDEPKEGAD